MANWLAPKIDWSPEDFYNFDDLNRVENNIEVIAELIGHYDKTPNVTTVKNRVMNHIEFADSLNRIESNQNALRKHYTPVGWIKNKLDWESNDSFNFEDAARLESNLALLYFYYFGNFSARLFCGMVTCGEDVL